MSDTLTVSNINYRTISGSTITASTITGSRITASTITVSTIFSATGQTALGNSIAYPNRFVEVGSDVANSMYLDFHSSDAALPDYSTRIISQGGATTGTGGLNMYASTIGLMGTNGVGIGTTAPNAALHLSTAPTANGIINVNSNTTLSSTAGSQDILQRWVETTSNTSIIDLSYVRIATGSDWSTTGQRFQSKIDATWQAFMQFNLYGIQFGTGGSTVSANSIPTVMSIIQSGNVGIGVTNPTYNFQLGPGLTTDLGGGLRTQFSSGLTNVTAASVRNGSDWKSLGTFGGSGPYTFTTTASSAAYFTISTGIMGYGTVYQFSITASGPAGSSFSASANGGPGIPLTNLTTSLTVYTGTLITDVNGIYVFVNGPTGTIFTFSAISVTRLDTVVNGYLGVGGMASPPAVPLDVHTPATGRQTVLRLNCTVSSYGDSAQGPRLEFYTRNSGNSAYYFQSAIQSIADSSANGSGSGGLAFIIINNTVQQEAMRISSTGNVGIGTTNPISALQFHGKSAGGIWNNSCLLLTNGITTTVDQTTNGTSIQFTNGANSRYFNIMTYGYSTDPYSTLYITSNSTSNLGVILNSGGQSWGTYSDSRMKIDVTPLPSALSSIIRLNPVSYLYDVDPTENTHIVTRIGFLADEVDQIYPNLVTKNTGPNYTNSKGETFQPMTLCMTDLIPYLTKGIQELASQATLSAAQIQELSEKATSQASQIQELASQTPQLTAENAQLKSQLTTLEARLAALEAK